MKRNSAFTLIELLVVIAIIALLVSILMPSLQKAKEMAKNVVCMSNQRSVALAIVLYVEDYDDQYPYNSGGDPTWHFLNWAHKVGRIADDPNLLPNGFATDATTSGITDARRICTEGYVDYNFWSRTEGHFKCPGVQTAILQKAQTAWGRQFSASWSLVPGFYESKGDEVTCLKTTDARKRAVLIGDCTLKPSGGIDASIWFATDPGTTKLRVPRSTGDKNAFGPWPFQPTYNAWGNPATNRVDFYGHPGDRANLGMTDGSIESVRETDPEDWSIR